MTIGRRLGALLLAVSGPATAAAQSELRGRIVTDSGVPVPGATITLAGIGYSVRSDSTGLFRLAGTPGSTLSLTFHADGFRDDSAVTSALEHVPGVRIRGIPGSSWGLNRDMRIEDTRRCPLTVYLDRVRVTPILRGTRMVDERINTLVQPSSLSGIEVYPRHLGAPPEFTIVDGTCGLVLLWTK